MSVLLCVLVAESLTRCELLPLLDCPWSSAWWRERWLRYATEGRIDQTWYPVDKFHPVLGHTMYESLDGIRYEDSGGVFITSSNALGARGTREYTVDRQPGMKRVVFIGDSFTFGQGVSDHETFPAVLESLAPDLEAINLAVHAYGHDQMLLRLRLDGLRLEPDLVVLGFLNMDVARNDLAFRDYLKPRFELIDGRLELANTPLDPPREVRNKLRLRCFCYVEMLLDRVLMGRRAASNVAVTGAILDAIVGEAEEAGARVVFLYLPTGPEAMRGRSLPLPVYRQTCADHRQLTCVDATAAIHDFVQDQASPERFFVDHYEPEIHRIIALELLKVIGAGGDEAK